LFTSLGMKRHTKCCIKEFDLLIGKVAGLSNIRAYTASAFGKYPTSAMYFANIYMTVQEH
jgi:hypothetical protein